jgi:hypothetical protein
MPGNKQQIVDAHGGHRLVGTIRTSQVDDGAVEHA